ncbi:MAG: carbohydrate kinase [Bacteroidaceae bacterium]|nr:carbohydrate kinase [Bacteroidaceae bacterium]
MEPKKYDVVALGELLIDFTENGLSEQGNPMLEANPGGAPCNVLAMLQNYGYKTSFIGKVGNDTFGKMLAETIRNVGIGTEGLVFDDKVHTTLAFVHSFPDGDREFSFYRNPGADMMLSADEVTEELITAGRIFHFGTLSMTDEVAEAATVKALKIAKENNMIISFDPNLRPPLWSSLDKAKEKIAFGMGFCDILKISDNEIEFFTEETDIDRGIAKIREQYPNIRLVCATLGKDGSKAYYGERKVFCEPFLSNNTIETTGAGDTFMASMLKHVLEFGMEDLDEASLRDMLTTANAAASIITTRKGALKVMPTVDEIKALIAK